MLYTFSTTNGNKKVNSKLTLFVCLGFLCFSSFLGFSLYKMYLNSLQPLAVLPLFDTLNLPYASMADLVVSYIHRDFSIFCDLISSKEIRLVLGEENYMVLHNKIQAYYDLYNTFNRDGNSGYKRSFSMALLQQFNDAQSFVHENIQPKPSKLIISGLIIGSCLTAGIIFSSIGY